MKTHCRQHITTAEFAHHGQASPNPSPLVSMRLGYRQSTILAPVSRQSQYAHPGMVRNRFANGQTVILHHPSRNKRSLAPSILLCVEVGQSSFRRIMVIRPRCPSGSSKHFPFSIKACSDRMAAHDLPTTNCSMKHVDSFGNDQTLVAV